MQVIPKGSVTFLFSDIEGSTRLWEDHPDLMSVALARHDGLARIVLEQHGGFLFKLTGDGFCAAFPTPAQALEAAIATQIALLDEPWPHPIVMRVRMALHTGAAEFRDHDYFGQTLNRVSRLMAAANGGQILVSQATQDLLSDYPQRSWSFLSLGAHRLRDLSRAETVFQAEHERLEREFPAIKTLENPSFPNNLPIQFTSFVGREKEIAEIGRLFDR